MRATTTSLATGCVTALPRSAASAPLSRALTASTDRPSLLFFAQELKGAVQMSYAIKDIADSLIFDMVRPRLNPRSWGSRQFMLICRCSVRRLRATPVLMA